MKCVACSLTLNFCEKCYNNVACYECSTNYILDPTTKKCFSFETVLVGFYANIDLGIFVKCSKDLENCEECTNNVTCTKCMELTILR